MKNWKPLTQRVRRFAAQPDSALLIELASAAVLLAWMAHWAAE
ncbi:MAG TPA: hypothetical protein VHY22_17020 [Chthoniobacteraceae bacterium]|jgi:hypothetical protein|nr:hypothetical protein [Chthoniobacteraceae bacterium]